MYNSNWIYGYVFMVRFTRHWIYGYMYSRLGLQDIKFTVMYSRLGLLDIEFTVMHSFYQFNKGDTSDMLLTSRHGSGKFCIPVLIWFLNA